MFFYIDESGHTGTNLFDPAQPILYYGILSSKLNIDVLAEAAIGKMCKEIGVSRLHAKDLGVGRLVPLIPQLLEIQKRLDLRFDLYRIAKADYAIISFFDQVFDQGLNPAITWTGYWTPLRYMLLMKVASLFDEEIAKKAWAARIDYRDESAIPLFQEVCEELRRRVPSLPDVRSRQLVDDGLHWEKSH